MAHRVLWIILAACALAVSGEKDNEVRELGWDDLLPADEEPAEPSFFDHTGIPSFDNFNLPPAGVVPELNGQVVKLPGYMVPLDLVEDKVTSSLLVPYFGACIHVPPPPPNQIVYVTFSEPIEFDSIWDPVWVTGKLGLERFDSEFVEAGYSMEGQGIEEYHY